MAVCGKDAEPTKSLLPEYNEGFARMGFDEPTPVRTIMTKDWRLTIYKDQDWGELYDRQKDPLQTSNLRDDPDHAAVRSQMMEHMARSLMALMDESPRGNRPA